MTRATNDFAIVMMLGLAMPVAVIVSPASGQPQSSPPSQQQPQRQLEAASPAQQTVAPAPVPAVEQAPFKRGGSNNGGATSQPAAAARAAVSPPQVGLLRVGSALAVVIALIFVLRWLFRRVSGGIGGHRPSRAVRVLGRSVIAPRQQLLVLQVGRRVVVVGDSGQQLSPLCEITDPDEVAELVAQLRAERAEPLARTFSTLFGRADAKYAEAPTLPPSSSRTDARGGDEEEDGYPRALPPGGSEDANVVAATREELDGLMSRVRGLSNQFRRSS